MILGYKFDFQSINSKAILASRMRPNPGQQDAFQSRQSALARPAPTPQTALAQQTCKQAGEAGIEPTRADRGGSGNRTHAGGPHRGSRPTPCQPASAPTPQTALAQRTCKQARRAGIEPTRGLAQRTCKQARRAGIEPTRGDPIGLAGCASQSRPAGCVSIPAESVPISAVCVPIPSCSCQPS